MPKGQNQKLKILYLMRIMLEETDEEHSLTLQQIISRLGDYGISAERKSLYDDIEALGVYGIDIETVRSKSVGYYVANRTFELPELKLLVDAVQSSKFITKKKSAELIKKIESFASRYEARELNRQVYVANRIKTMNESIYYIVDYIHSAISKNCMISFKYYEWNEKKEKILRRGGEPYEVSPWALTWDDENYYLVAFDSEAGIIKHYRVDKMTAPSVSERKREGEEFFNDFDMAQYAKKTFGMFGGRDELVTLRCKNSLAGVMIDRFGEDITLIRCDGEHFEFTVKIAVSRVFLTWLMNFGSDLKITAPETVIEEYKDVARAALEL